MNRIVINGKRILGDLIGRNIKITSGTVIIDGKNVTPDSKEIAIQIEGNVNSVNVDCCNDINITGSTGNIKTGSGDINCGEVEGDISTGSGDVKCKNVQGRISTGSGDVIHRR